eukprot:gene12483-14651_t
MSIGEEDEEDHMTIDNHNNGSFLMESVSSQRGDPLTLSTLVASPSLGRYDGNDGDDGDTTFNFDDSTIILSESGIEGDTANRTPTPYTSTIDTSSTYPSVPISTINHMMERNPSTILTKSVMKRLVSPDDIKARVAQLDNLTNHIRTQIQESKTAANSKPRVSLALPDIRTHLDYEEKSKEVDSLYMQLAELSGVVCALRSQLGSTEEIRMELESARREIAELKQIEVAMKQREVDMQQRESALTSEMSEMSKQRSTMVANEQRLESELAECRETIELMGGELKMAAVTINDLQAKARADELVRRALHNTVQELKGNIRVFCRMKPGASDNLYNVTEHSIEISQLSASVIGNQSTKKIPFQFDRVFAGDSSQATVFGEIAQLVQSSLDGYNTSIFTYGATGSGKTYTMEGTMDNPGMIPRAVQQVFETASVLSNGGWVYSMEAFFLEIYNEQIHDLLAPKGRVALADQKLEIKHDGDTTKVSNLNVQKVTKADQVHELLATATRNRAVAKTLSNERSSRSHSVFQLKMHGKNETTGESRVGLLNLIDLAGSERVASSGVTGDRLKETQAINKSLSSLSDVITALANKEAHIPYRNSKLTYLLQNSLGGNSKTLMFVNISPEGKDVQESISSLRFATKVNSCDIGTATRKQSRVDLK